MRQLHIPQAATKTWSSQKNFFSNKFFKMLSQSWVYFRALETKSLEVGPGKCTPKAPARVRMCFLLSNASFRHLSSLPLSQALE